jgi:hypothetical protein
VRRHRCPRRLNPSLLSGGREQRSRCGRLAAAEGAVATLGNEGGQEEGRRELWRRSRQAARQHAWEEGAVRDYELGLRFGTTVPTILDRIETEPNQINTTNYLNQIKLLKTSTHLRPIQTSPIQKTRLLEPVWAQTILRLTQSTAS